MSEWPEKVTCERGACGKVIKTKVDQFSVVDISGNVVKRKGDGTNTRYCSGKFVLCSRCTKKQVEGFRRRNIGIGLEEDKS